MKITANRLALFAAVKTALRTAGKNANIPEIGGVYIRADADAGTITLIGTDVITQIQCRLTNEQVEESGIAVVQPLLSEMLRLLDGDTVRIETDTLSPKMITVSSGNCRYTIPVKDAKAFPVMQIPFPEDTICVQGINGLIRRTVFAAERKADMNRKSLEFIRLSFDGADTRAQATNGQIGAVTNAPHCSDGKLSVTLHYTALQTLAAIVSPDEELFVGVSGNYAVFMKPNLFFFSMQFTGEYMDGERLLSYMNPQYRATVDGKQLYALADNVSSLFGSGDDPCVNVVIADDSVIMQTQTATGRSTSSIAATDTAATPAEGFNFNAKLLLDCLKNATGPAVLSFDSRGFLLLEANQSQYFTSPRRPVRIALPAAKPEKKTRKTKKAAKKAA